MCNQNCNQGRDCDCAGEFASPSNEVIKDVIVYILIAFCACFLWLDLSEAVVTFFGLGMAQMPGRGDYEYSFFDSHPLDPRCIDDDSTYECDSCGLTIFLDALTEGKDGLICRNCKELEDE